MTSSANPNTSRQPVQQLSPTKDKSKWWILKTLKKFRFGHTKQKEQMGDNFNRQWHDASGQTISNQTHNLRSGTSSALNSGQQQKCAGNNTPNIDILQHSPDGSSGAKDPSHRNEQTMHVVQELKYAVQERLQKEKKVDESFIEEQVTRIRAKANSAGFNMDSWKKYLPTDVRDCSDTVLMQTMAYGNDPRQLISILKDKMNKEISSADRPETSLANVKAPLETLKRQLKREQSLNLFAAVLEDIDINRADRMFYSEAHRLVPDLTDYTMYNAHDQVQAIRLTHYQSDNEYELKKLIKEYRTFAVAYSYLQDLARQQVGTDRNTPDSSKTRSHNTTAPLATSIVRYPSSEDDTRRPNLRSTFNSTSTSSSTTPKTTPFRPSSGMNVSGRDHAAYQSHH